MVLASVGGGWVSTYSTPDVQKVESIKITGDTTINASSKSHGTGIGSGCHGTIGTITIGDGTSADNALRIISMVVMMVHPLEQVGLELWIVSLLMVVLLLLMLERKVLELVLVIKR